MKKKGIVGSGKRNIFGKIKGYLTKDDIVMLEEAGKRVYKHAKNPAKRFECDECQYNWLYPSMKCPVCASPQIKQVV